MALYGVTALRFDEGGVLKRLKIGLVDGAIPAWAGPIREVSVLDVVDLMTTGDVVYLIFPVEGLTVTGPKLAVRSHANGVEYLIEEGEPAVGRRLQDMPKF